MIKVTYRSQSSDTPKVITADHLSTDSSIPGDFKLYEGHIPIFYGQLSRIVSIEADTNRITAQYEEHLVSRAEGQGD